jgi:hypothetical protein
MLKGALVIVFAALPSFIPAGKMTLKPRPFTVRVIDNMTKKPIAGVEAKCNGIMAVTNAAGFFQLDGSPGDTLKLTHSLYRDFTMTIPELEKFQVAIDLKAEYVEFEGGMHAFYSHFQKKLTYPRIYRGVRGRVYAEFRVRADGTSKFTQLHGDESEFFRDEVKKCINTMPAGWSKTYTDMSFLLPFSFLIEGTKEPPPFKMPDVQKNWVMEEIVVTAGSIHGYLGTKTILIPRPE